MNQLIKEHLGDDFFNFQDARVLLGKMVSIYKQNHKSYSNRKLCKALGFSSPSYLKLILDGERKIPPSKVSLLCNFFKLDEVRCQYFELLVAYSRADVSEARKSLEHQLKKIAHAQQVQTLGQEKAEFFSNWFYIVLFVMLKLKDFKAEPKDISKKLNGEVGEAEVCKALQTLKRLGLVEEKKSSLKQTNHALWYDESQDNIYKKMFWRQFMNLTEKNFDKHSKDICHFGTLTADIPHAALPDLKNKVLEFQKELVFFLQGLEDQDSDQVVHINFNLFPILKHTPTDEE